MDAYFENIKKLAQKIIGEVMPSKISEACELCADPRFSLDRIPEIRESVNLLVSREKIVDAYVARVISEVGKSTNGGGGNVQNCPRVLKSDLADVSIPVNKAIVELEDILRPFIVHISTICNDLRLWIELHIPKVEDGHNFGVGVQEEIISELSGWDERISQFYDFTQSYYTTRAILVKKVLKFPQIEDFKLSVLALDEKQFVDLRHYSILIRECYITLHRSVTLNHDKILHPRPQSNSNMY